MNKLHFAKSTLFRLLAPEPCRQFARRRVVRRRAQILRLLVGPVRMDIEPAVAGQVDGSKVVETVGTGDVHAVMTLTPHEARAFAILLTKRARDAERELG